MARSMTGWGDASGEYKGIKLRVEIKSVNNRYLDINVRLPRAYLSAEEPIKSAVTERISRGKTDIFVTIDDSKAEAGMPVLNITLAKAYFEAAQSLSAELGIPASISAADLLRIPDVLAPERSEDTTAEVTREIIATLSSALDSFEQARTREGEFLTADITQRITEIETNLTVIERRTPEIVIEYRAKMLARLREILLDRGIDDARVLTEAAIFADKTDVTEETVRLRSHIAEFKRTLKLTEPIGRRIDFQIQEINREINTIGSKCSAADLAAIVIDMKATVEKMREQSANIE